MKIAGVVALVTGSNRGIGAAIVEALLAAGARRVYAGARTPSPSSDPRVVPLALDVTDAAQVARAAADHPDVQLVVNNAGIATGATLIGAGSLENAQAEMAVNYFGVLQVSRAFAPVLAKQGGGALVNVLSIVSHVNLPAAGSYSASKAAAYSLTQGVRAELAAQGTLVVGVMPGFVDTDMARRVNAPKISAADVARALVDGVERGVEDVYPGEAANLIAMLYKDPKAVERHARTLPGV